MDMKRVYFSIIVALCLFFAACEKENVTDIHSPSTPEAPELPTPEELVLGTWTIDCEASTQHEEYVSSTENWTDDYTLLESGMMSGEFVFNADGTGTLTTVYGPRESYTDPLNYVVSGDTLSLGSDENYKIEKLDSLQMVLFMEGTSVDRDVTYSYSVRYVLDRAE